MAESRFIRTVSFGGFDRSDVIKRLEFLNNQIYDLKNELRETKLLMEDFRKGTPEEKSYENVITVERAKLTEVQVKNETLNAKIKASAEDIKNKDAEIAELRQKIEELTASLAEAKSKLDAYEAGNDPMAISQVFVQAQVSSNQLTENAKADAEKMKKEAEQTVEEIINDANNSAAQIIYEAERTSAEKIADAQNRAEQMDAASGNLRASVLEDVKKLTTHMAAIKAAVSEFNEKGTSFIGNSEKLLEDTRAVLEEGGVPVFRIPETVEADIPEPPAPKKTKRGDDNKKKTLLSGLDTLDELTSSVLGDGAADAKPEPKSKKDSKKTSLDSSGLDELLKQSELL